MPSIEPRAPTARETAYITALAELDVKCIRRLENRLTEPATIADYQDEIVDRLQTWIGWHTERGEARGMLRVAGWQGLDALYRLADAVTDLLATGEDDTVDAALSAAHEALWNVKRSADMDRQNDGDAMLQCREIEESDLRQLLRVWSDLELIRRAARDGRMPAERAQTIAAEVFVFNDVPGYPPRELMQWH